MTTIPVRAQATADGRRNRIESDDAREPTYPPDDEMTSSAEPQERSNLVESEARTSFRLSATELFLELESSVESRRVRYFRGARPGETYVNTDLRFEQMMGIRFEGFVLDPNFLEFHGGLSMGLSQERYREDTPLGTRTDSDDGFLSRYDLSISGWRNRPVSLSAYARRVRDRLPRQFLPSLLDERTEFGASLLALTGSWTTEVGFSWSDLDRTSSRGAEDDEHSRNTRFYVDSRGPIADHQELRLSYDFQRDSTEYQGSRQRFRTTRNELRLDHQWEFGRERRHRLDTFLRYNDERGDLARDEFEFTPRLTLRHGDTFQTVYRYSLYRYDQSVTDWTRHKADVQATWRPSREWRITGDVFALREEIEDDLIIDQYGGSMDATYSRPINAAALGRLGRGEFSINAAVAFDRAEHEGTSQAGRIRGEIHVLDTVRPTYLSKLDVNRLGIVAYNATRTRIFRLGVDYSVLTIGRRTAVFRSMSGWIAENEPVYFDYDYEVPLHATVDTFRGDLSAEYALENGFTPFYRLEVRREHTRNEDRLESHPDETERHRFGLRYDQPTWSAAAEAELYHDSVLPYDAYHFSARAALLRTEAHSVDSALQVSRYLFKADFDRRHVWWVNAELSDRVQLSPECSGILAAIYRYESDSIDGRTNGVDLQGGLTFRRGYLQVELTAEYDLLSLADSRDSGYGVWLNVRRDLSHAISNWRMER